MNAAISTPTLHRDNWKNNPMLEVFMGAEDRWPLRMGIAKWRKVLAIIDAGMTDDVRAFVNAATGNESNEL
jgi:hypothetical protein